ncbi:MAG: rhomboid family intramembrane serine protease [Deltaproteobacteria bacterium]|nr:MAG: rhomboid family intramembrane serine protease [Deltaproteobacteria bacterium]
MYSQGYRSGGLMSSLPPMLKNLLIAHTAVFLFQTFGRIFLPFPLIRYFALIPGETVFHLQLWRPITYLFLHADPLHFLFNMLMLYWFGRPLEEAWGGKRFLRFYLVCGIGAGLFTTLVSLLLPHLNLMGIGIGNVTIGASGAICGLIMAMALLFPYQQILLYFLFPISMRHACYIFIGLDVLFALWSPANQVSVITHLGGFFVGWLYLTGGKGRPWRRLWWRIQSTWERARDRRKMRNFRVIRNDEDEGRGPTLH